MGNVKYYYEEKGYGDVNAQRFEEGASPLLDYQLPCAELTFPYTALTWLMVDFLENYYLTNQNGLKADSFFFWNRAKKSSLFQFERIINGSSTKKSKMICRNVANIYEEISEKGFNLAKPVPITMNPDGILVALKGAKRIAALLTMGVKWVNVREYDRQTLSNQLPNQEKTSCKNHTDSVFTQMTHIPAVSAVKNMYRLYSRYHCSSERHLALNHIKDLIDKGGRMGQWRRLQQAGSGIARLANSTEPTPSTQIAVIIEDEIEIMEWLILRRRPCTFIIGQELKRQLGDHISGLRAQVVDTKSTEQVFASVTSSSCSEIWSSDQCLKRLDVQGANKITLKAF